MIVDDEFGIVDILSEILKDEGYHTVKAGNGRRSLILMREHAPDLVLLDVMMPILGGDEVLDEMRNDTFLCDIPVLIVSGCTEEAFRKSCTGSKDYQGYFEKPFSLKALLHSIRTNLTID